VGHVDATADAERRVNLVNATLGLFNLEADTLNLSHYSGKLFVAMCSCHLKPSLLKESVSRHINKTTPEANKFSPQGLF
jgi:hypothetical protein